MWNSGQQQAAWWPNYSYAYQAAEEGKYLNHTFATSVMAIVCDFLYTYSEMIA